MHRNEVLWEPNSSAAFSLAYQRLAEEDAKRRAWLDEKCRLEDPDERRSAPLELKTHESTRCKAWGCNRNVRAKGLCDTHYRISRRGGMTQREFRAMQREKLRQRRQSQAT